MNKLYKLRQRPQRLALWLTVIAVIVVGFIFMKDISRSFDVIFNNGTTEILTGKDAQNVRVGEIVSFEAPSLEDTGWGYFVDEEQKHVYSISFLDRQYLLIVQSGSSDDAIEFETPEMIRIRRVKNDVYEDGKEKLVADFADYQEIDEEEALDYFNPAIFELVGYEGGNFVGDAKINFVPFILMGAVLIVGAGVYIFLRNKGPKDIQANMGYDEAVALANDLEHPIFESGSMYLTYDYLVRKNTYSMKRQIIDVHDIGWAYLTVNRTRYYGLTVSKVHQLTIMINNSRESYQLSMPESMVRNILEWFIERQDLDVMVGFEESWTKAWYEIRDGKRFMEYLGVTKESDTVEKEAENTVYDRVDDSVENNDNVEASSDSEASDDTPKDL